MIHWVQANRLKFASFSAVLGDFLMGMAGAVGVFHPEKITNAGDMLLLIGGLVGVAGHGCLMIWGKGGRMNLVKKGARTHLPRWLRGIVPWRYPLDTAFAMFVCSGSLYTVAGYYWDSLPMLLTGVFVTLGSGIGWLYPEDRTILGFHTVRITALLYLCGTTLTYVASWQQQNLFMLLAALAYTACNVTLYSVRKEHQSTYTQTHG